MRLLSIAAWLSGLLLGTAAAAPLPVQWEDLTSPDFVKALKQSDYTCVLPFGTVEKNGPSGPLGSSLIIARAVSLAAARQEYAIVFPPYYVANVTSSANHPGAIAYSVDLQLKMLEETVSEMGRNGCKKILIVNAHSPNEALLGLFQSELLVQPRSYVVYTMKGGPAQSSGRPSQGQNGKAGVNGGQGAVGQKSGGQQPGCPLPPGAEASKPGADGHGGEGRNSLVMAVEPGLVHPERAHDESSAGLNQIKLPNEVYTTVSFYDKSPNNYEGDASGANAARGKLLLESTAACVRDALRAIKADNVSAKEQQEVTSALLHPADNPQDWK